jgi:hypothetical protein
MKYSLAIVMLLACASLVQAEPGNGNAYGKAHAPGQNKAPGEPAQGHAHGKNKQITGDTHAAKGNAAGVGGAQARADWRVYDRFGQAISASALADAVAVEAAVKKAGVDPYSQEAAMIRISMGQSPEMADKPNDGAYNVRGEAISHRQASERFAAIAVMERAGIDPDSEQAAQIRAAAEGRIETADGEEVDQQTLEDVAKEIAVQEAIIYTGAEPGSADESLIRMGADVFMEKLRSWRQ